MTIDTDPELKKIVDNAERNVMDINTPSHLDNFMKIVGTNVKPKNYETPGIGAHSNLMKAINTEDLSNEMIDKKENGKVDVNTFLAQAKKNLGINMRFKQVPSQSQTQ